MNNQKILELAEQLFLRNPYDKPEKLFKLAEEFEAYLDKYVNRLPSLNDLIGPKDCISMIESSTSTKQAINTHEAESEQKAHDALVELGLKI